MVRHLSSNVPFANMGSVLNPSPRGSNIPPPGEESARKPNQKDPILQILGSRTRSNSPSSHPGRRGPRGSNGCKALATSQPAVRVESTEHGSWRGG